MDLPGKVLARPCADRGERFEIAPQAVWLGYGDRIAARHRGVAEGAPVGKHAEAVLGGQRGGEGEDEESGKLTHN